MERKKPEWYSGKMDGGQLGHGEEDEGEEGGEVEKKDEGEAETELEMLGFVVPEEHAEPRTDTAADDGNADECRFPDAPTVMLGFVLVDAEQDESQQIDQREIDQHTIASMSFTMSSGSAVGA